jgi:hypothetical protein
MEAIQGIRALQPNAGIIVITARTRIFIDDERRSAGFLRLLGHRSVHCIVACAPGAGGYPLRRCSRRGRIRFIRRASERPESAEVYGPVS